MREFAHMHTHTWNLDMMGEESDLYDFKRDYLHIICVVSVGILNDISAKLT